jgi:hypothetical protein
MATKAKPGLFDCYAAAQPDEPLFVLLGRDVNAPSLVEAWANVREQVMSEDPAKIAEARTCAKDMRAWLDKLAKQAIPFDLERTSRQGDAVEQARCAFVNFRNAVRGNPLARSNPIWAMAEEQLLDAIEKLGDDAFRDITKAFP